MSAELIKPIELKGSERDLSVTNGKDIARFSMTLTGIYLQRPDYTVNISRLVA